MANSSKSVKQEPVSPPPAPQPSPSTAAQSLNVLTESQKSPNLPPPLPTPSDPVVLPAPEPEAIVKSLTELCGLSASIQLFKCRYDELQNHLNFIEKSIDARFKELTGSSSSPTRLQMVSVNPDTASIESPAPRNDDSELKQLACRENGDALKEIEHLCQTMCSRGVRKHLLSRLSDIPKLREEVPAALKLAPNPAKLVFECIGRFFLQGRKAYVKDSPMITARQASVLILEFFLRMMGDCADGEVQIESSIKQEAESAALSWRKRLITEGGIHKACLLDARGLLLFVACFGIPAEFRNEDIRNLIVLSNPSEISEALRRSRTLLPRIPDIIEAMLKYKLYVETVDVVLAFGIEDRYPPKTILTSFLRESKEAAKKTRSDASLHILRDSRLKELNGLRSIIKCLEDYKVDPSKLIPGWQVKDRIISLVKEITELDKKILDKKRKMDESEASHRLRSHEMKRSRFTGNGSSPLMFQPSIGLHEQRVAMYGDSIRSFPSSLSQDAPSLYPGVSGHSPSSMWRGSGALVSAEPSLYPGVSGHSPSSMWRGSGALVSAERYIGRSYGMHRGAVGMDGSSPSLEGFVGVPSYASIDVASHGQGAGSSLGSDLYRFADSVAEREVTESRYPGVPDHLLSYMQ